MKKLSSLIPVVLILFILAALFVFMCLPQNQSNADSVLTVSLYFFQTRVLNAVVLGGIFMAAFYHLTLYVFRRREIVYLLFSVFCLAGAINFIFISGGLNDVFEWIPKGAFLTRFSCILGFLYHNTIAIVGLYILDRRFLLAHRKALAVYMVLGIAYYLLVPISFAYYRLVFQLIILSVSLFVTIIGFRSSTLRENRWTWLYFISFIIHLCAGTMNLLIFPGVLYVPGLVSNLFMVLSQSVLLSKNYTDAFLLVEQTNENLEQLVDNRTKDLQNTNNAMKELVGNISHDLKTPLAVMSVNLEELSNLSQTLSDENYQRCVRVAYEKNRDLRRLIQNLFDISRIETGQSLLQPDWVSLPELLREAQDKYDDYLKGKGIFFEIYCTTGAKIYADPQRIWSVFDNIIYNAARYTAEDGVITINAAALEKTVTITITDTGCGIAPEHLPHIFERFYKASASRGAGGGESGLGLYIVKSIMEATGGSVTAESEPGKGTSMLLRFQKNPN